MLETIPEQLKDRLLAASYAASVEDGMRDIADAVASWDAEGISDSEIDRRIRAWMNECGLGYDAWLEEMKHEFPSELLAAYSMRRLWDGFGIEQWAVDCVRSLAFTDEPIGFLPFAAGYWMPNPTADPPTLVAVLTALSDPQLAARQIIEKHAEMFGKKAGRVTKAQDIENARMLHHHRQGMSYNEIAIQNVRKKHPDVIDRPGKYHLEVKRERERVVKSIKAAQEVWKERGPEFSTEE